MKRVDDGNNLEPEQQLANAIIAQAADDYRTCLRNLKINPRHKESMTMLQDCESFFRSEWYQMLTTIDGEMIMRKIREEELAR